MEPSLAVKTKLKNGLTFSIELIGHPHAPSLAVPELALGVSQRPSCRDECFLTSGLRLAIQCPRRRVSLRRFDVGVGSKIMRPSGSFLVPCAPAALSSAVRYSSWQSGEQNAMQWNEMKSCVPEGLSP